MSKVEINNQTTTGSGNKITTASRTIASVDDAGFKRIDFSYDRVFDEQHNQQYKILNDYRDTLNSILSISNFDEYIKDTFVIQIKNDIKKIVVEEEFKKILEKRKTIFELYVFLESYIPYYYLNYSYFVQE